MKDNKIGVMTLGREIIITKEHKMLKAVFIRAFSCIKADKKPWVLVNQDGKDIWVWPSQIVE